MRAKCSIAIADGGIGAKRERREQRRRAARRERLSTRLRWTGTVAAVLAVPGLYAVDRAGPQELVDAEVVEGIEAWVREVGQGGQSQNRDKGIVQTSREVWRLMRQSMGASAGGTAS